MILNSHQISWDSVTTTLPLVAPLYENTQLTPSVIQTVYLALCRQIE